MEKERRWGCVFIIRLVYSLDRATSLGPFIPFTIYCIVVRVTQGYTVWPSLRGKRRTAVLDGAGTTARGPTSSDAVLTHKPGVELQTYCIKEGITKNFKGPHLIAVLPLLRCWPLPLPPSSASRPPFRPQIDLDLASECFLTSSFPSAIGTPSVVAPA